MSGLFSSNSPASEFMGFVIDEASIFSVRGWAERQGHAQSSIQQGGVDAFARYLESAHPPKVAVVDLDGQSDFVAAAARLVTLCGKESRLVLTGSTNDVTLYRKIIATGAVDYLVKPLTLEHLNQALTIAMRPVATDKQGVKEARIIVFVGSRGGVGASTIALNSGWMMAHDFGLKTVLLDLDLQFGTSSLALDLEPGRGLRDIVSSPHRVDNLMITSSMTAESENFWVLGAEEAVDEIVHMDANAVSAMMKEMKSSYEVVVIDLPHFLFAPQKRLFPLANEIVIVSELSLSGIRDTLRVKNALNSMGCAGQIRIVAARADSSGGGQIDTAVFEKGVQGKIDFTIVEDTKSIAAAANTGKALAETAPREPITRALRDMTIALANIQQAGKKKASLFDKFLSKTKHKGDARSGT